MKEWLEIGRSVRGEQEPSEREKGDFLRNPLKDLTKETLRMLPEKNQLIQEFGRQREESKRKTNQDLSRAEFCSDYVERISMVFMSEATNARDRQGDPRFALLYDFVKGINEINERFRNSKDLSTKGPLYGMAKIDDILEETKKAILTKPPLGLSSQIVIAGAKYGHAFYKNLYSTLNS